MSGRTAAPRRPRRRQAVGPRLRRVLAVVFALFAMLVVNAAYLGTVTFAEWLTGETYQDYFYQLMFLAHLALGLALLLPFAIYGAIHVRNAHASPNRLAVRVGYGLLAASLVLLASGLVLTRGLPLVEVRQPQLREVAYWLHVAAPLAVAWLFVLHRLAGPPLRWRAGRRVMWIGAAFALVMLGLHAQDPRRWGESGPASGEQYFQPSLARTASGGFIPAASLMMDGYCAECHADVHERWAHSAHRFSSFNNPAYLFSVCNTRTFAVERDGDVQASRFCAGCHDPVPFFSGAFDDPAFDDVDDPTAHAGITCTSCHAITHVNSPRGNADYTIEEPLHYPFATSDHRALRWINRLLVKAKPAFHRKTFLKPLHRTPEFCGTCHKVHLPAALNGYRWLRGQNHYDSYHLSGVSGHGVTSFYYPDRAEHDCNGCHMRHHPSEDFGADPVDGRLQVRDHQFPAANTALPALLAMPAWVNDAHRAMLEGAVRVDLFAIRDDGRIDGALHAPLRPALPVLEPGRAYLLEVVLRTVRLGHLFTEGTADSNEVWLEVVLRDGDRVVGRSGARDPATGAVDRWSHFVNAYVVDRDGNRIDRRNAEDIFVALYNHQIPPGAADVVHYRFVVPADAGPSLTVQAALRYRKFDAHYTALFAGPAVAREGLPIVTLGQDEVILPVAPAGPTRMQPPAIAPWQRWNDYGIGLLRKPRAGQLRQAEEAFAAVAALGRPDGPLNLARVRLREGRLDAAAEALREASASDSPPYPWTLAWLTAQVDAQNGYLDAAVAGLRDLAATRFADARARGFDFGQDYRLLNQLASLLVERTVGAPAEAQATVVDLQDAVALFERTLALDPENAAAHYGLAQAWARLGEPSRARHHQAQHERYRLDDNARDRAIRLARGRDPAADHAAEPVVLYDLQRPGAIGLPLREADAVRARPPASDERTAKAAPVRAHGGP